MLVCQPASEPAQLKVKPPACSHAALVSRMARAAFAAVFDQLAAVSHMRPRPAIVAACGPGWAPGSLPDGVLLLVTLQQALSVTAELP